MSFMRTNTDRKNEYSMSQQDCISSSFNISYTKPDHTSPPSTRKNSLNTYVFRCLFTLQGGRI